MNFSRPFIERPIGTTLLAIGLFLAGVVAYFHLPVASLPVIEFPTIRVTATLPGGDPETMAARVAAPLERRLGEIPGVRELTSTNALGVTRITIQFDPSRSIVGAAQDVQAAINAAIAELPADMPSPPSLRKSNPAAAPILILALTSKTIPADRIYDYADTVIVQRLSQVEGVSEVTAAGAEQPAVRVSVNPMLLSTMGLSIDDVRSAIVKANTLAPLGFIEGSKQAIAIESNSQLGMKVEDYNKIVVKTVKGDVVRLGAIAEVKQATRNARSSAMFNNQPAILLYITKAPEANVIDTVDRIKALIPTLRRLVAEGIEISVLTDRTTTLRASIHDMQTTLALSVVLVMLVVYLFLLRPTPTIAAGITVPLSLAGTCAAMWAAGFSVNNLTLMALAVSVGFVVDDAIVMIENMFRNLERGVPPMRAALDGARQIGFTVVAISVSLVAAFIPLLFNTDVNGRLLREFSVTLVFAVVISTVISLTVTPMICAHFVRSTASPRARPLDRAVEGVMGTVLRGYARTLDIALRHRFVTMIVMLATVAATVNLYYRTNKGTFPQDDTGLIFASTVAATDISYEAMAKLQQQALQIVLADPAVDGVGSSVGGSTGWNPSVNQGRMFISLKPLKERGGLTTQRVIDRLRRAVTGIEGLNVYFNPGRDIRVGARQGRSEYQFTFWSPDFDELYEWVPKVVDRLKEVPGVTDVSMDREAGGLQAAISIDRQASARLGVQVQDINAALNNAFAQRQISIIYTERNQYRVILEVDPRYQREPSDLNRIFVPGRNGVQVPLSSLVKITRTLAPVVVNHQGPFPAVTINYGLSTGMSLAEAQDAIRLAIAELRMPDSIRAESAGDARAFEEQSRTQVLLILAALIAVYIVLGVLYESLAHPVTIISTLPAAGLGALVALRLWGMDLTVIALIGIILLIGIVKKNGIMLVDFALEAERERGFSAERAIHAACLARFRPIMMTTFAALLGAVPLAVAVGPGSELRRPLGITIIGGLIVSQVLTLYTTPVIYLTLDRLHRWLGRRGGAERGFPAPGGGVGGGGGPPAPGAGPRAARGGSRGEGGDARGEGTLATKLPRSRPTKPFAIGGPYPGAVQPDDAKRGHWKRGHCMPALRRGAALVALIPCLLPAAPHARADELLVMPYSCTMLGGRPLLTPGPERGHRIVGQREKRKFTACSPANPRMCRHWTVYRFDLDCDGVRVPWVEIVGAAGEAEGRARLADGRLQLRVTPRWSLSPDDPCAYEGGPGDPFAASRRRRYCAERLAQAPPAVVEMPLGFAPMLGIDAIFVKAAPDVAAAPPPKQPGAERPQPESPPGRPTGEAFARQTPPAPPPPAPPPSAAEAHAKASPPAPAGPPPAAAKTPPLAPAGDRPPAVPLPKTAPPAPEPKAAAPSPAPPSAEGPRSKSAAPDAAPKVAAAPPPRPNKDAGPAKEGAPPADTTLPDDAPGGPHIFSILRTTTTGVIVAFTGLTLGLLIAFGVARRRERLHHAGMQQRAKVPRLAFDDGREPPARAAPALVRVPGASAADAALAAWGDGMPRTRTEAFRVLGIGIAPGANAAAIKKIVDALRVSWHPDLARDESDRQLRELRSKQINAAWELLQGERAEV